MNAIRVLIIELIVSLLAMPAVQAKDRGDELSTIIQSFGNNPIPACRVVPGTPAITNSPAIPELEKIGCPAL